MSRVVRYQESIKNFIHTRSCLSYLNNTPLKDIFINDTSNSRYLFPILLLTILNSQHKKNHISFQGYYVASSLEFLKVMIMYLNNPKKYNTKNHQKLLTNLVIMTNKSVSNNIDVIKKNLPPDKVIEIQSKLTDIISNNIGINGFMTDIDIIPKGKIKNDIYNYYFKNDMKAVEKLRKIKVISSECLYKIMDTRICKLAELATTIAWILGCGSEDKLPYVKKIGKHFGIMYQLALDFYNVIDAVNNATDITYNYVVNCGFQNTYEQFIEHKQKFIEGLITLDIYTGTAKEIIGLIESMINNMIEQTSPDLLSNYSTI